jgi:cytochrome c peroxidase
MPGSEGDTPARVALGRKLYFERGMSLTQSQSCNDCHFLQRQRPGVDGLPTSPGAKGIAGTRNAPTVLNAGFQKVQFWDGRAADLVEQAKEPLLNPIEMAMATEQDVIKRVKDRPDLVAAFHLAFPDQPEPVTFDNLARALAAFERTLVTPSRFDRYLRGQTHALTREEKHGLNTFMDLHCIECHSGIPVGGRLLRKLGVYRPYENQSDLGRFDVTRDEQDKFVFKVGMLRNVTLTAPYFHDGRVPTLSEAIRRMAAMQLEMEITPAEIDEIICFLRTLEAEKREWIEVPAAHAAYGIPKMGGRQVGQVQAPGITPEILIGKAHNFQYGWDTALLDTITHPFRPGRDDRARTGDCDAMLVTRQCRAVGTCSSGAGAVYTQGRVVTGQGLCEELEYGTACVSGEFVCSGHGGGEQRGVVGSRAVGDEGRQLLRVAAI